MKSINVVTREDVRRTLIDWHEGRLSAKQVLDWAGDIYTNTDYDYEDWEGSEDNSVTNEVLAELDMLNMNLRLPEDVPIYMEFLSTPYGKFDEGYQLFQQRLDSINYDARRKALRNDPFYAPFIAASKQS